MRFPVDGRIWMHFKRGFRAVNGRRPCRWLKRKGAYYAIGWPGKVLNLWYSPRHGYRPIDLFSVTDGRVTGVEYWPALETNVKKIKVGASGGSSMARHLAPVESNILDKLPNLIAHCAVTKYEDGDPRKPGWVTVKTMGAAWVVEAKDPDACARLTATADTLDNALVLVDMLLGAEEAPWENDPWLKRQGGKTK